MNATGPSAHDPQGHGPHRSGFPEVQILLRVIWLVVVVRTMGDDISPQIFVPTHEAT